MAQKISRLDFSEKSSIKTSDELMELSQNINTMADNIKSSMENLNTFVSNASHELKTPIAVINTHTQLLMGGRLDRNSEKNYHKVILKESKYMDTLVKDLLLLSKLSSNFNLEKEEFNLKDLLKESMEKFEFLELKKDLTWEIDLASDEKILELEEFLNPIQEQINGNSVDYYFHYKLAELSQNAMFVNFIDTYYDVIDELTKKTTQKKSRKTEINQEHRKIVEYIVKRDKEKAVNAMLEHLRKVKENIKRT